jgi:hypothetical protein
MTLTMPDQVRRFCIILMIVALFFWSWALKNTVAITDGHNFDLGIVSFGTVLLTSSYVLGMVNGGTVPAKKSVGGVLFLLAPVFVAINYVLGAILGFGMLQRPIFGIYCVIFVILWLIITWYAHELLKKAHHNSSSSST